MTFYALRNSNTYGARYSFECDGVDVGSVVLLRSDNPTGRVLEIWSLEVWPEYRRLGHGRAMMRAIVAHAQSTECKRAWLRVNKDNVKAIELYRTEGFKIVGERHHDFEMERYV